jgi:hypothetical protein
MSPHEQSHIDYVLEELDKPAGKHGVRAADLDFQESSHEEEVRPESGLTRVL